MGTLFRLLRVGVLLAFALGMPIARAADADIFEQSTGIAMPDQIAGFVRGSAIDFEASYPGQGVALRYEKTDAYAATLYVYIAGLVPFPTSLDEPSVVKERSGAAEAVLLRAREKSPLARRTGGSIWQAPTQPAPTPVEFDTFIVYPTGTATNDFLFLWLAKNRIWKLRITRAPAYRGEITPVPFVQEIVQRSVSD